MHRNSVFGDFLGQLKLDPLLHTAVAMRKRLLVDLNLYSVVLLVGSLCGSSKYQKQASERIILLKCTKDIKGHLMKIEY